MLQDVSHSLKFMVLGAGGAGKTSIVRRFVDGEFTTGYKPTIGCDFQASEVEVSNGTKRAMAKLVFWDMAGQSQFMSLLSIYMRGSAGLIVVADSLRPETLEDAAVERSYGDIGLAAVGQSGEDVPASVWIRAGRDVIGDRPVLLLLNKSDMNSTALTEEQVSFFVEKYGVNWRYWTSAKTGINVTEAVHSIASHCVFGGN